MSRDIIVLVPNGRRMKVHCTADTNILQVLEDVCAKHGFEATNYDLKHHNHILDLTTTIRFCNLPNKAMLEMVEAERQRVESNVTVGLMLNDGERITGDFSPNTSLYDLITSLVPNQLLSFKNPTILYMRQEVIGLPALKEKTLRQLGLLTGRAILRLLDKTEAMQVQIIIKKLCHGWVRDHYFTHYITEIKLHYYNHLIFIQANVSTVYRRIQPEKIEQREPSSPENKPSRGLNSSDKSNAGPSGFNAYKDTHTAVDPISLLKKEKYEKENNATLAQSLPNSESVSVNSGDSQVLELKESKNIKEESPKSILTQENLERRLRIEEEVTFVGSQKAIAFMQPDVAEDELSDLPDDFYELSIEEVRKIYHELQQRRSELENTPMLTATKREEILQQNSLQKLNTYKNVVVRIQFPDNIILQGVFTPSNTLKDVQNFVKEHLHCPDKSFHIFTTPLKETLDSKITLLEAKFVPCVHMHFKWLEEESCEPYLKEEIYLKKTTSDAASILASKYRAPNRRKLEESSNTQNTNSGSSSSKQSKMPKWFKK